jgi:hypothetical protein
MMRRLWVDWVDGNAEVIRDWASKGIPDACTAKVAKRGPRLHNRFPAEGLITRGHD